MTSTDETSWQLLFDIALSHGESLRLQKLSYAGLQTFLESAELVGPQTSVFPLLVERLWHEHSRLPPPAECIALFGSVPKDDGNHRYRVVGLEGFTDIMNVVSVRCYQTQKLSRLCNEKESSACDLKKAITLSSEDYVRLEKSVAYTANEYLKSFIFKNTIHPSSVVSIDPNLNDDVWTPNTKRLVQHIVEHLCLSVVIPLFTANSGAVHPGCMCREEFDRFVCDVFPRFTKWQRAAASAVFGYSGLHDLQRFLELSAIAVVESQSARAVDPPQTAADPPPGGATPLMPLSSLSLKFANTSLPLPMPSEASSFVAAPRPRLIGLDGFVDAMLMLSVVLFADERAFPRHRAITAKIWGAFVDYYCPAAARAKAQQPMTSAGLTTSPAALPDPLLTADKGGSLVPTLSQVYPMEVPVDCVSSLFLNGLWLRVDPAMCTSVKEADTVLEQQRAQSFVGASWPPPRLLRDPVKSKPVKKKKRRERQIGDSLDFPSDFSGAEDEEDEDEETGSEGSASAAGKGEAKESKTFLTGGGTAAQTDNGGADNKAGPSKAARKDVSAPLMKQAMTMFTDQFEKGRHTGGPTGGPHGCPTSASPESPWPSCHVFVDEEDVQCIQRGPNHVEALLPLCTWQGAVKLMKLRASIDVTSTPDGGAAHVTYTPFRYVQVSLRDATGERVFSSVEVVMKLNAAEQTVPAHLVTRLRDLFNEQVAAASPDGERLPLDGVVALVLAAGLAQPAAVEQAVRSAVSLALHDGDSFTFCQSLAVVAMLPCTRQLGGSAYTVPNLVNFLHLAFASHDDKGTEACSTEKAGQRCCIPVPYSGFIDVPFHAAFHCKEVTARESAEHKEALFRQLRTAREQLQRERQQVGQTRILPPFPVHLSTNPLFTRRLSDRNRDGGIGDCPAEQELKAVAKYLQDEFIQQHLVVRPFAMSQKGDFTV